MRAVWTAKKQSDPRAVKIIESVLGKFPQPFSGLHEEFWDKLPANKDKLKEFISICVDDFPTFCALMYRVVPKGRPVAPFVFNRPQRIVWKQMRTMLDSGAPLFLKILKARQLGMSTLLAAWVFFNCWRQQHMRCITMAVDVKLAEHIISMLRVGFDGLPDLTGVKPRQRASSRHATIPRGEMYFADRDSGNVTYVAKNLEPRGLSAQILWQSEKAFYENASKIDAAILPTLPTRGSPERARVTYAVESTPNGMNPFYEEYMDARHIYASQRNFEDQSDNEAVAIFLPWQVHDEPEFGGYAVPLTQGFRLTEDEQELQKKFSRIRQAYDGKEVTLEQMKWYRDTLADHPYFGDVDYFNAEYPSDDYTCFTLSSDNAFKSVMPFLSHCVDEAKEVAEKSWAAA